MQIQSVAAGILAGLVLGGVAWAGHELKSTTRYYVVWRDMELASSSDRDAAEHVYDERKLRLPAHDKVLLIEEECSRRSLAETYEP